MMQVQLKQSEIEAALKSYIAQQGINLTNKTVTCTFTAGRKDSGISVELEIEEQPVTVPSGAIKQAPLHESTYQTEVVTPARIALQAEVKPAPVFASAFHNGDEKPAMEAAPVAPTSSLFS